MQVSQLIPAISQPHPQRLLWAGLTGASRALAISEATLSYPGLTLVITANSNDNQQLLDEVNCFTSKQPELSILHLPDWETLPYDSFSPHEDITSQRLATLYQLPLVQQGLLVVSVTTLMHRLPPTEYLQGNVFSLSKGQQLCFETLRQQLEQAGYCCVDSVYSHGEFALRGAILDLFPMGSDHPFRIERFDDTIESLRIFDPENQRSQQPTESIQLLPAKEFPITEAGIKQFKQNFQQQFSQNINPRQCLLYKDISQGITSGGIEYFLPLFFSQTATLFDYLPQQTRIILAAEIDQACQNYWAEINHQYEQKRHDIQRPLVPPEQLFLAQDRLFTLLKPLPRINFKPELLDNPRSGQTNLAVSPATELRINTKAAQPLTTIADFITQQKQQGGHILFCAESAGRKQTLLELLQTIDCHPTTVSNWAEFINLIQSNTTNKGSAENIIAITVAPLELGFTLTNPSISLITESQLFGPQAIPQRRRRQKNNYEPDALFKNLTELSLNAPVVHIEHGVGRYRGLTTLDIDQETTEFLTLEYAEGAKLYVPVASLHLISRYSGVEAEHAPLHHLGSEQWQREKRKAVEKIHDVAAELLNIHARRQMQQGMQYHLDRKDYELFAAGFPFEETLDQQTAIEAVIADMTATKPMDRLICGDVGFGKTEVAMRATFIAIQSGKQVAVLVPTTLLAQQHYTSFCDRFADWPVSIELLSRFKSQKQQQQILQQLTAGKIDLIIGTHKLLQPDIKFDQLGLVIIDEEHRFGVRHKEKLKSLRANVDLLTLTATPIPRTLNMAMNHLRDISLIATPPAKRLSVKTFVKEYNSALIKEAITRELLRGGQVFYLHNKVQTIEQTTQKLQTLIPDARIAFAHGQMREQALEQVMSDFYHKRYHVLVCTTIIETGIDIPTANTMIIERADHLGLAQLHQLRGRVGRSHHQAYAYLLTPNPKAMTQDAHKRLEAIANTSDLGAGFVLASHDLEIRGAGELLGDEQSGQMQTLGFSLYMDLLDRTINAIKAGNVPSTELTQNQTTEIKLNIPAIIPDHYLPDVHNRLILYKRIANAVDNDELMELQVEMIDRFGSLPEPVKNLFQITRIKLLAEKLGISKIEAHAQGGRILFNNQTQVDPMTLVQLVQNHPNQYQLAQGNMLKFQLRVQEPQQRIETIAELIAQFKLTSTKRDNNHLQAKVI